jgi:hypothetical protein
VATLPGHTVALAHLSDALAEDCRRANIVVSLVPVRGACPSPGLVIDRFDVWRKGAHAISLTGAWGRGRLAKPRRPALGGDGAPPQTVTPSSIAAHEADEAALNFHLIGAEDAGFIGFVGRFERNRVALAAEPLECRLFVVDKGDHD